MPARALSLPLLLPLALLAGCGGAPTTGNGSNLTEAEADAALDAALNAADESDDGPAFTGTLVPPAPGEPGGLPDDRTPLDEAAARVPTSVEASGATVERWGLALAEGRHGDAWRLWREDGGQDGSRRGGMSEAQHAQAYRRYAEIHVLVGRPEAGGTQTARVPVQMYGRMREDGRPFNLFGMMTLARNPQGQRGEPGQPPWLITASELKPMGEVRVLPEGAETSARRIPAAFRGRWSGSRASCDKPGDDMRLAVTADSLTFYESAGTVTAVRSLSPTRISLTADYSGEGETWTETATLALSEDGNALAIGGVRRVRCA